MRIHSFIWFAILLSSPARASTSYVDPWTQEVSKLKSGMPSDVAAWIDRLAECQHFASEDGFDSARAKEIETQLTDASCDRIDADEQRLKSRYKTSNSKVLQGIAFASQKIRNESP